MSTSKEKKQETLKKEVEVKKNMGDTAVQIELLTEKIKRLSSHLQKNKKDFVTQRALIKSVNRRRKLLNYLKKNNLEKYRSLLKELDLRK